MYRFRQAKQETHETLDQFHTRLRSLAQTCNFHDVDFEIEQQIITAGTSSRIRKRAKMTFTKSIQSHQSAQQHVEIVEELTLMQVNAQRKPSSAANVVSTNIMLKFVADSRNQCVDSNGAWIRVERHIRLYLKIKPGSKQVDVWRNT